MFNYHDISAMANNRRTIAKKRREQMKYVMENFKLDFSLIDSNSKLNETFNISDDENLNNAGITFRIINLNNLNEFTMCSCATFMARIQPYLPKSKREESLWKNSDKIYTESKQRIANETKEVLYEFIEFLNNKKAEIEDYIASSYYVIGKNNHLEVLKRRFKDSWSERTEQNINADVKEDTQINIVIEDY